MTKNITIYKKHDGTWVVKIHRALGRKLTKYEVLRLQEAIWKVLVIAKEG